MIVVKEVLGSKMCLLKEDIGLSRDLLSLDNKPHRIKEDAAVKEVMVNLKPDSICIDVGANMGYYALLEARLCPEGFVYAIEPIKENITMLKKSIELNGYKNIKTFNLAAGAKTGTALIQKSEYSNCGTMCNRILAKGFIEEIKVDQISLTDFCKAEKIKRVDFIRMDIEGYETEVIKGMAGMVDLMPPGAILNFEIHMDIISRNYLMEIHNDKDTAKKEYWRSLKEKKMADIEPFVELFSSLTDFRFKPFKHTSARDSIADIGDMEKLRRKVGVDYCSHMFFEKEGN